MPKTLWQALSLACLSTIAACQSSQAPQSVDPAAEPDHALQAAEAFDVFIESPAADNLSGANSTLIAASVFVPAHRSGESYPLIVHSHGWGGDRVTPEDVANNPPNDEVNNFYSSLLDRQVKSLWEAGYAVISFDERGFQDSAGAVRVMDPDYETVDAIAVLDWAEANLNLRRAPDGDPYIGALGGSYGGGFQLLLAALDPRLDALVAGATWYDLVQSLAPNAVLKKLYDFGLCFSAIQAGRNLDPMTQQACMQAGLNPSTRFAEDLDPAVLSFLGDHGMGAIQRRHEDPEDAFRMRAVDALLVQGNRDVLFPLNQAMANARFLAEQGGDVRLISNEHGHFVGAPLSTQPGPGWWGCGPLDSLELLQHWFDAKLRGAEDKLDSIPRVCLSLDDQAALRLDEIPLADERNLVSIPPTQVDASRSDFSPASPLCIPRESDADALRSMVLAGLPKARLEISPLVPGSTAVAFVGIGVQDAQGNLRLVDDQVSPLRSDAEHQDRALMAIGERLAEGERPGVLLYGTHHQYEPGQPINFLTNAYTISGQVALPLGNWPIVERL